jgi:protein-disulfide isomerase
MRPPVRRETGPSGQVDGRGSLVGIAGLALLAMLAVAGCRSGEPGGRTTSAASPAADPTASPTAAPLVENPAHVPRLVARLGDREITLDDVAPDVAFQIYQRQVDVYSLLESQAREIADRVALERAARDAGLSTDDFLRREVDEKTEPVTDADVDAWLAEHPRDAAAGDAARPRVRFYLEERQRIERRLALLDRLRADAGYEIVLPKPVEPRVRVDTTGAPARGAADAPVTIVHFASFASPLSARSAAALRALDAEYPDRLRFVHRNYLDTADETGVLAAELAIAVAREQPDRFWELHDRLFAADGRLSEASIAAIAAEFGIAGDRLQQIRDDPKLLAALRDEIAVGRRAGVPREPAAFVNGRYASGTFAPERLQAIVREEVARASGGEDADAAASSRTRTRTPSAIASPG